MKSAAVEAPNPAHGHLEERMLITNVLSYYSKFAFALGITPAKLEIQHEPPRKPKCKSVTWKFSKVIFALNLLTLLEILCTVREVLKHNREKRVETFSRSYFLPFALAYGLLYKAAFIINNWGNFSRLERLLNQIITDKDVLIQPLRIAHTRPLKAFFFLVAVQILLGFMVAIGFPVCLSNSMMGFEVVKKFVEHGRFMFWLPQYEVATWNEMTSFDFIICGIAMIGTFTRVSMAIVSSVYILMMCLTLWTVASGFSTHVELILAKLTTKDAYVADSKEQDLAHDTQQVLQMYWRTQRFSDMVNSAMPAIVPGFLLEGVVLYPLLLCDVITTANLLEIVYNTFRLVLFGIIVWVAQDICTKMEITRKWLGKSCVVTSVETLDYYLVSDAVRNNRVGIRCLNNYSLTTGFMFVLIGLMTILLFLMVTG